MFGTPQIEVKARLAADGSVTAKAIGSCSYGDRTATVDVEITDPEVLTAIGEVLATAVDDADDLKQNATSAAAECLVVATKKSEKVFTGE